MALAVWSIIYPVKGLLITCNLCKKNKEGVWKIQERPMSYPKHLCLGCRWKVYKFGLIAVGKENHDSVFIP